MRAAATPRWSAAPPRSRSAEGPPGFLYGDAFTMSGHASGGDDTLLDTAAAAGDADSMSGHARGGNDTLIGGNGRADPSPATPSA